MYGMGMFMVGVLVFVEFVKLKYFDWGIVRCFKEGSVCGCNSMLIGLWVYWRESNNWLEVVWVV